MSILHSLDELSDLEKLSLIPMSYSRLETFDKCEQKYFHAYVEMVKEESSPPAMAGVAVHEVLEHTDLNNMVLKDMLSDLDKAYLNLDPENTINNELKSAMRDCVIDFWSDNEDETFEIIGKELGFEVVLGNFLFRGFIDRVDKVGEDSILVTDYKGLALDTPLPTPVGWTTMGKVKVGDYLFGADGKPTEVIAKSTIHNRPCYELTFSDGSKIKCDNVHLWSVNDLAEKGEVVLSTDDLYERFQKNFANGKSHSLVVKTTRPLDLPEADLPVDPYTFGYWFGSKTDDSKQDMSTYKMEKAAGLIPTIYTRASIQQRIGLLQGLFDSSGYWNQAVEKPEFVSTRRGLLHGVESLLDSLGITTTATERVETRTGYVSYRLQFRAISLNPFRFSRYKEKVADWMAHRPVPTIDDRTYRKTILDIQPVDSVPTQCVSVDSEDSLYLCGPRMTVTHNTGKFQVSQKDAPTNKQMGLYAAAIRKLYPWAKNIRTELYYLRVGKKVGHTYTDEELDAMEQSILEASKKVRDRSNFTPNAEAWVCRVMCSYGNSGHCARGKTVLGKW